MERDDAARSTRALIWGLFLIALGGAFLLEQFGMVTMPVAGLVGPAALMVVALTHFLARRPGSGVMFTLIAAWLVAVNLGWTGMTYRNSWGLLLVAVGAGIVVRALSGEEPRRMSWAYRIPRGPRGGEPGPRSEGGAS